MFNKVAAFFNILLHVDDHCGFPERAVLPYLIEVSRNAFDIIAQGLQGMVNWGPNQRGLDLPLSIVVSQAQRSLVEHDPSRIFPIHDFRQPLNEEII